MVTGDPCPYTGGVTALLNANFINALNCNIFQVYASAYRIISDFFSDADNDEEQKAGGEENQLVQYSF